MPKVSARATPIDVLVQRVEASGAALGKKATELSRTIELARERLVAISGKRPVKVEADSVSLRFERHGGDWDVWLVDGESEPHEHPDYDNQVELIPLVRASITRKARAFPLLPKLLLAIEEEQERQLGVIVEAFQSSGVEPVSTTAGEKEGNDDIPF